MYAPSNAVRYSDAIIATYVKVKEMTWSLSGKARETAPPPYETHEPTSRP